jgi:hypothetical protein
LPVVDNWAPAGDALQSYNAIDLLTARYDAYWYFHILPPTSDTIQMLALCRNDANL